MYLLKYLISGFLFLLPFLLNAQVAPVLSDFDKKGEASVESTTNGLLVSWPAGNNQLGKLTINTKSGQPLFESFQLEQAGEAVTIAKNIDPMFLLTVGERDLSKESGWNIFFDRTAYKPHETHLVQLEKSHVEVLSDGQRSVIKVSDLTAGNFSGWLEVTLYHGSPLVNIAAVMHTEEDAKAILYDAGLVAQDQVWNEIFWSDTEGYLQSKATNQDINESENLAVKYRTIIGESEQGSMAVFPAPHQFFYPLDNAYNLKYVWSGENYRNKIDGFGIGIRHDLMGDNRHVPWFNAPPKTDQRLNFFVYLSATKDGQVMEDVKKFTRNDQYKPLPGYRTMASHFHTEHMDDILTHKPVPDIPGHVKALRTMGVNIMHLGEYHLAGNPRDPGPRRLPELDLMFAECERLSTADFLMLPGEEPNCHFGGHWMNIFPNPVYWIMSRQDGEPFVEDHPEYGKVYRVGNKEEMLRLLEEEKGLAWTAHARTKGSTGYPDAYKDEAFFHSDRFNGAAWKSLPADLSNPNLGRRVLKLMDDMANWGERKYVIGEADLFKLEPDYEIYGNMNVNYLQLDKLPKFEDGWQPVLDAMESGKFFVTTGEVLLPTFSVNGKGSGEVLQLEKDGKASIKVNAQWTFPLQYAEIVSGDGEQVYRETIDLKDTQAFGTEAFTFELDLTGRSWVRLEIWDAAVNGAFTQPVWIE
ncbi:hypothetical protein [Echinicola vietnamensis]|uniref:Uncharacterized protein n=1 Tax=Echinicola vietnamensis (strain DSM 17526 / LMG 23754 / KMM 6221) TaxID=926556 RepID=L0G218_ECHVK|nr:hypothetical protein [Echinicola vietnamensis]AGA79006.1 hypothetical protein Echvi_2766 [Echinicola vietnamensis DSM 17526]